MGNSVQRIEDHKDKLKELVREAGLAQVDSPAVEEREPEVEEESEEVVEENAVEVDADEGEERVDEVDLEMFDGVDETDKALFLGEGKDLSHNAVMERVVDKYVETKQELFRLRVLTAIKSEIDSIFSDVSDTFMPMDNSGCALLHDFPLMMLGYDAADFAEPIRMPDLLKTMRCTKGYFESEFSGIDGAMLKVALTRIFWAILRHTGRYKEMEVCQMVIQLV